MTPHTPAGMYLEDKLMSEMMKASAGMMEALTKINWYIFLLGLRIHLLKTSTLVGM
jgi:hypothetical protein